MDDDNTYNSEDDADYVPDQDDGEFGSDFEEEEVRIIPCLLIPIFLKFVTPF